MIQEHTNKKSLNILDVACGTGNVVIACAKAMDSHHFDAIDISEGMLQKAKDSARVNNLTNINFYQQDVTQLNVDKRYDVITCSYALFFLPNPEKDIEYLCVLANINNFHLTSKEIRYPFSLDQWWELINNTGYKGMRIRLRLTA
jgi:2-polyprenyl-3-methyl-5-hydroxy-6-metoxy-1,4-benzoquinol methylase